MKIHAVHTCPVYEDEEGARFPVVDPKTAELAGVSVMTGLDDYEPVGWCNLIEVEVLGDLRLFIHNHDAGA